MYRSGMDSHEFAGVSAVLLFERNSEICGLFL